MKRSTKILICRDGRGSYGALATHWDGPDLVCPRLVTRASMRLL